MLVILLVKVCVPPNLKQVAICDDNTDVETMLSTKLNTVLTNLAIPNVTNSFCNVVIAVVFAPISLCNPSVITVVAYFDATAASVVI